MSLPGGIRITNQFDAYGRLKGTWLKDAAQTVLNYHGYDYNLNWQRTNAWRLDNARVEYAYDLIGQLTHAVGFEPGGAPSTTRISPMPMTRREPARPHQ